MGEQTLLRDIIVGSLIAAFASSMATLSEPPERRPTWGQAIGRMGVAMVVALIAGAVASDYFKLSPKLTYASCGAAGILGEKVIIGIVRWFRQRGFDMSEEVKRDGKPKNSDA